MHHQLSDVPCGCWLLDLGSSRAAERLYSEKATYLEILDAQRVLNETRIEYAETLFKYRLGLTILERSIGKDIAE